MVEAITLHTENGQQILKCHGFPNGPMSVRVVTEEAMQGFHEGDWSLYRKKAKLVGVHGGSNNPLTDPATIKAYDFLRHAITRETERREQA